MRGQCASSGFPNLRDRHILPENHIRQEVAPQSASEILRAATNMTHFPRPPRSVGPPSFAHTRRTRDTYPNCKNGGPERDQTADLVVANDALYQLSYRPERSCGIGKSWRASKHQFSPVFSGLVPGRSIRSANRAAHRPRTVAECNRKPASRPILAGRALRPRRITHPPGPPSARRSSSRPPSAIR